MGGNGIILASGEKHNDTLGKRKCPAYDNVDCYVFWAYSHVLSPISTPDGMSMLSGDRKMVQPSTDCIKKGKILLSILHTLITGSVEPPLEHVPLYWNYNNYEICIFSKPKWSGVARFCLHCDMESHHK